MTEVSAELRKQNAEFEGGSDAKGGGDEDEEDWEGIEEIAVEQQEVLPEDEEYVDEDKYTTVTVEAMEDNADREINEEDDDQADAKPTEAINGNSKAREAAKKRIWNKDGQTKAKKKKFRYESKAERQATRQKQKSKNHKAKLRRTGK